MTAIRKVFKSPVAYVRYYYPDYRLVDARKGINIYVLDKDIEGASRQDPADCGLSRACRRQDQADEAIIQRTVGVLIYHSRKLAVRYAIKRWEATQLECFDMTGCMSPGRYWLAPIEPCERLGSPRYKDKGNKQPNRRRAHELRPGMRNSFSVG